MTQGAKRMISGEASQTCRSAPSMSSFRTNTRPRGIERRISFNSPRGNATFYAARNDAGRPSTFGYVFEFYAVFITPERSINRLNPFVPRCIFLKHRKRVWIRLNRYDARIGELVGKVDRRVARVRTAVQNDRNVTACTPRFGNAIQPCDNFVAKLIVLPAEYL